MRKIKKFCVSLICIIFIFVISSCLFFYDRYFLIKPLPSGIPLEIRVDNYGDGHFGSRRSGGRRHRGIDLSAPLNTPVLCAKLGIVEKTAYDKVSGNYVVIQHLHNLKSYYLHLSEIKVKKGQLVKQAQVIGTVGNTGNANQKGMKTHLHFEIREDGKAQDIMKKWEIN
ncbi:MAG: M23 family metallopeptidase [Candidatus Omnitrophota bacterium]